MKNKILKKSGYYIYSLFAILTLLKAPWQVISFIYNPNTILNFKSGLQFRITQLIDFLILKETICDDVYKLKSLKNPKIIIDIGAGFGDFNIYAAKLYPKAQIIAFEPNPKLYNLARENLKFNKFKNVKLFNIAIGSSKQKYLNIPKKLTQSSLYSNNSSSNKILVHTESLDNYIKSKTDLLKIDCEGGEAEILKNITNSKLKSIKMIAVEYHDHITKGVKSIIIERLKKADFRFEVVEDKYDPNIGYIYATSLNNRS